MTLLLQTQTYLLTSSITGETVLRDTQGETLNDPTESSIETASHLMSTVEYGTTNDSLILTTTSESHLSIILAFLLVSLCLLCCLSVVACMLCQQPSGSLLVSTLSTEPSKGSGFKSVEQQTIAFTVKSRSKSSKQDEKMKVNKVSQVLQMS